MPGSTRRSSAVRAAAEPRPRVRSEMAARTVNKNRARSGESQTRSRSSTRGASPQRRGGRRSGTNRPKGQTKEQLYNQAKRLQRRGPLEHEQEPVATSGGGKKPLIAASSELCLGASQAGVRAFVSRGSGRAFGDPLLRRPPTYSDASPPPGFSLGAGGRIGRPVSFSPWPSYPALPGGCGGRRAATAYRSTATSFARSQRGRWRLAQYDRPCPSSRHVADRRRAGRWRRAESSRSRTPTPRRRSPRSARPATSRSTPRSPPRERPPGSGPGRRRSTGARCCTRSRRACGRAPTSSPR